MTCSRGQIVTNARGLSHCVAGLCRCLPRRFHDGSLFAPGFSSVAHALADALYRRCEWGRLFSDSACIVGLAVRRSAEDGNRAGRSGSGATVARTPPTGHCNEWKRPTWNRTNGEGEERERSWTGSHFAGQPFLFCAQLGRVVRTARLTSGHLFQILCS